MSVATGERVAVIIVSYNTRDETLTCVESLRAATTRPLEIVVVDNGSVDGSAAALREAFPDITVVEAGVNLGFAAGVNLGVESSTAPWVLLLNPDTVVLPAAVDAIVEFAERNPAHGVYGGRTLRPDGTTDPSSCWGRMTLWSLTSFALGLSTVFKRSRLFDPESLGTWQRDTVREVPVITGCLLLTSREDWHRIGGMDERFFLYGEDAEFSARAIERGMRPVIVPEATIIHAVGGSTSSSGRKMAMVMAGKATVLRTAWSRPAAAIGVGLLQAGAALRAAPAILRKRPDSTWAVVWRSRKAWRDGYPKARQTIFGQQPPAGDSPTGSVAASSPAPSAEFMQIWEEGYLSRRSSYEVMHLPYVLVLDGAPLRDGEGRIDRDRIRDYVARTLASTPTFRLRLQRPLLGLTPPAWVPDADFDLSRHLSFASEVVDFKTADVRRLGGEGDPYFDLRHPLWRVKVTELADGRVALGLLTHHSIVDGKTGMQTVGVMLRADPDEALSEPTDPFAGVRPARRLELPLLALRQWRARYPGTLAALRAYGAKPISRRARRVAARLALPFRFDDGGRVAGESLLPPRHSDFRKLDLSSANKRARGLGGSLSDLQIAAVMSAWDGAEREVSLRVPVSLHTDGERQIRNNVRDVEISGNADHELGSVVTSVRGQLAERGDPRDWKPATGRQIGTSTMLIFSTSARYWAGAEVLHVVPFPGSLGTDELSSSAIVYGRSLFVSATTPATEDVHRAAGRIYELMSGQPDTGRP